MLTVEQICPDNYEKVRVIYEDFQSKALEKYKYEIQPVEFEQFASNIENNLLGGFVLCENSEPAGLLIYSVEKHKTVEVNVIHAKNEQNQNEIRTELLQELLYVLKDKSDWKAISYPMLGAQEKFIKDIALLNFKLIGQSIIKYDFRSSIAFRIFKKAEIPQLTEHKLVPWDEKYRDQVPELINLSFKNTKEANFDPRFLTVEGSADVLEKILTDQYGKFLSTHSRLLLSDDRLEGVCLTTMVADDKLNIPLIAVRKDTRNKGMGKLLLKSVLAGLYRLISNQKIQLSEINATTDTDNYPAVNMYRRLGFKEESFYAHAYFKNKSSAE